MFLLFSAVNLSAFSRYCKREQNVDNNNLDDIQLQERLIPREGDPIIGRQLPREDVTKNSDIFQRSSNQNLRLMFDASSSIAPTQTFALQNSTTQMSNLEQFSSLKKLIDASSFMKTENPKIPIFPTMLGPSLMHPALIPHPSPPVGITGLGPSASNTCAKCGITFRMTSDLVYHMRTHHTRGAENWREISRQV